jgi:hypothetical protein
MDSRYLNTTANDQFSEIRKKISSGDLVCGDLDMYETRKTLGFCWAVYDHLGLESLSHLCSKYLEHLHLTPAGARFFQKRGRRNLNRFIRVIEAFERWGDEDHTLD